MKFLSDRVGLETGHERTGSPPKLSFCSGFENEKYIIDRGNSSLDEMTILTMASIAKAMGGGSVQPGTEEFNFSEIP